MDEIQNVINRLNQGDFNEQELKEYLGSSIALVKANAILAVFKYKIASKNILDMLYTISLNGNQESKVIGVWTNGHLAVAVLKLLNADTSLELFNNSIRTFDEITKKDIERLINQLPQIF
jgi:hypothetical protein